MVNVRKNIKLYIKFAGIVLKSTMQYKVSFILQVIGRFILAFNGFVGIFFLFSGITNIKGYTYGDILLCFAVMHMSFYIAECIGSGFKSFEGLIRRGEFDRMMLRPCSLLLQVIGTRFELGRLGPMVTAVVTLVLGIQKSSVEWSVAKCLVLIGMIIGGVVLFVGLFLIGASICFFSIADAGIINVLTYGARDHGKYPMDIYGKGLLKFGTFVIPYTLVQYYPLQFLLGRSTNVLYALSPLGVAVFAVLCYALWCLGVRNYQSCGN